MSNLLPHSEQKKVVRIYRKRFVSVGLILLALMAVASTALLFPSYFLLKNTQGVLKQKENILNESGAGKIEADLTKSVQEINGYLSVFNDDAPTSPIVASVFGPLTQTLESGVRITSVSYTLDTNNHSRALVEIAGTTTTREALLSFSDNLRAVPDFSNISVPITNFIHGENATFIISLYATLH